MRRVRSWRSGLNATILGLVRVVVVLMVLVRALALVGGGCPGRNAVGPFHHITLSTFLTFRVAIHFPLLPLHLIYHLLIRLPETPGWNVRNITEHRIPIDAG
jgi:hypothetical protein